MKRKKKIDLSGMSIQAKRQYLAKFESFEAAQERVEKRKKQQFKHGILPSNAPISSAYGAMKILKDEYGPNPKGSSRHNNDDEKRLYIVSIPMGGMNK